MSERGLVGVAALWLMVAVGSLALAVLALAKWNQSRGRNQTQEIKMVFLAETAALLQREAGFVEASRDYEFPAGRVHVDRTFESPQKEGRLICRIETGKNGKQVEVGWDRVGEEWKAIYWREL